MIPRSELTRRHFLKAAILGSAAAAATRWGVRPAMAAAPAPGSAPALAPAPAAAAGRSSRVALTTGEDGADIAFRGLKAFEKEIAAAIGDKRVIVKPNNVDITTPLACSAPENLEGILEFLKSIGKTKVVIAECSAGNTVQGFANMGYNRLAEKYGVPLLDLDTQPCEVLACFDQTDLRAHPVRMSSVLLDPNSFVISAAKLKTHNLAIATLSLKNIVLGAPVKTGGHSDKSIVHGGVLAASTSTWPISPSACIRTSPSLTATKAWKAKGRRGAHLSNIGCAWSAPIGWPPTAWVWN